MDKIPEIMTEKIKGKSFIEQIMNPHISYYHAVKELQGKEYLHGMAHITGGGLVGNLQRVLHEGLCAEIDLSKIQILPIFKYIKDKGKIRDVEMLRTFNMGVGFVLIVSPDKTSEIIQTISKKYLCYEIGRIFFSNKKVSLINELQWEEKEID